ncbi:MAG: hypothetical protein ACOYJ6_18785 [Caulobacterales bacterium]
MRPKSIPPPGKAARNERRKARAALMNGLAGALFAVGVLQPAFAPQTAPIDWLSAAIATILGFLLHALAHGELRKVED